MARSALTKISGGFIIKMTSGAEELGGADRWCGVL